MVDEVKCKLEMQLYNYSTAMDGAIKQIELVLRSNQVGELASAHLKQLRDSLVEVMHNE